MEENIGIVLCTCAGSFCSRAEAEEIAARLRYGGLTSESVLVETALCGGSDFRKTAEGLRKKNYGKILFAGCPGSRMDAVAEGLAGAAGIPRGAVGFADIWKAGKGPFVDRAAGKLAKSRKALAEVPVPERVEAPLLKSVLVVGTGESADLADSELRRLGYETLRSDRLPLSLTGVPGDYRAVPDTGPFPVTAAGGTPGAESPAEVSFGSLLFAGGTGPVDEAGRAAKLAALYPSDKVLPLEGLEAAALSLPRAREVRTVAIILDHTIDETKASTEKACRLALELQKPGILQVYLLCKDIRVGSLHLEALYDEARDSGAVVAKYEKKIAIRTEGDGVMIDYIDSQLGLPARISCSLAGISLAGLDVSVDGRAEGLGLRRDRYGLLQDNNIHQFSAETNRPGVFVSGPWRGTDYLPSAREEAIAGALAVHGFLSPGKLSAETMNAQVDPDKCVLCLTCVRSCPFKAMRVDAEKGAAASGPFECKRCGICAGECPAKAISLPAYSDAAMAALL
jgi:ferredoxin